ncbi:hypothetical protein [Pedobacter sp.]|uniref:hypothetical protein n=1 Tax=Pedobacter sp. TaxID=1411316 RepID=UPI0031E284E6
MRIFLILNILLFFSTNSYSQKDISQKLALNRMANPTTALFVHFDKNIYSNNETAYFTAYLLKTGKFNRKAHKILAVALIRDMDTSLVKLDKFLIENGLAFGNMTLPDSIVTGNYHFLAYTDKLINGKPELTFKQHITIKTNIDLPFKGSIAFLEKPNNTAKDHKLLISVTSNDNKFLPKPTTISYRYGKEQKTVKTDASGQLLLSIPKQESSIDPNIYVKLKYLKDSSFLSLNLPPNKTKAIVKFFPMGGHLVNNLASNIGWEVTNPQKKPIAIKAFLYKNDEVIDTIETSSYGIGKFQLSPEENAVYTVKLAHEDIIDSIYSLPKALKKGLVLNIANVLPKDTLQLFLRNTGNHKVFIRVHNFNQCFVDYPLDMEGPIRRVKIPLNDIPKGIQTVTITDSLDRPLAEQIFFAHYDNKETIKVETDNPVYLQREKVTLKLTPNQLKSNAVVSVAVVQENRVSLKNSNDIETYSYIKNELANAPASTTGSGYKDKNYLEQILLVKGWRRYTWQQMLEINTIDTIKRADSLLIVGEIKKGTKQITKPITLAIFGDSQVRTFDTSPQGDFNLHHPEFISEYGKKMYLFVNASNKDSFNLNIKDSFEKTSRELAKTEMSYEDVLPLVLTNNADMTLKSNEKAIRLKEVTITSRKDNDFNYSKGSFGANECGDYVCKYNILNCKNHVNDIENTQPIPGRIYGGSTRFPYKGCITYDKKDKSYMQFSGISYYKEFYLDDYKDPLEPAFFSTIYWNYGTILKNDKETELSFYTSDITGMFKIIVQGITDGDVVYSEKKFEVKNKGQAN